ncbi:myotubularin-related protein 12-like isoform X2 [Paramormyrops kingsleyae]|uniref:myotubularin-related protein 12-like isoform X2 n=1 Tax=Paramormyrops kingsleyae TaxID=1676925 RepID=UPI000CD65623|nr:myotubularin-related protein 12-like isoform X2 [Paramormyrops kingsleyae]
MFSLGSNGGKYTKPSFVSYVNPEKGNDALQEKNPVFLPGEVVFCSASPVLKCTHDDLLEGSIMGTLFCTNFRISFVSDQVLLEDVVQPFRNRLYGENDIPLTCVDQIYGDYDEKRKLITNTQMKNKHPNGIIVHCKDLRVFQFSLKLAKEEAAKKIFQGIVRHSLEPKSLRCIFAFSYCENIAGAPETQNKPRTLMFENIVDWMEEMKRTKGNCKLLEINKDFTISQKVLFDRLPQFFFIPTNVLEKDLAAYQGKGVPIWCWSHHSGCALFKTASLPLVQEESFLRAQKLYMERMLNAVAHNYLYAVKAVDLSETLPSIQDIQQSYSRFKQNFLIDNIGEFWISDMKWFSTLETTRWLSIIRQCLHKAVEVVEYLEKENTNILLIEDGGTDLSCVISSLVQLMLDPHYRTLTGFQSLVQKEWVVGGHNFLERCNHLNNKDKESPVFLLFLECVWQLLQQHSLAFQFSETYLTVLSDSISVAIFSTFIFSSPYQRVSSMKTESQTHGSLLNIPSVWDWSLQFDCKSQEFLFNPLYREKSKQEKTRNKNQRPKPIRQLSLPNATPPKKYFFKEETESLRKMLRGTRISRWMHLSDSAQASVWEFYNAWQQKPLDYHGLLLPDLDGPAIRLWMQRYLRWIPEVQIFGGGDITLVNKITSLSQELEELRMELEQQVRQADPRCKSTETVNKSTIRMSCFFPFASCRSGSFKPAIPTSHCDGEMDMGHLAEREDEDTELTDNSVIRGCAD